MLLNLVKLGGLQLFKKTISWVEIFLGWNFPGWSYPDGNFPRWGFSGWELSDGNYPGGNFPGGSFASIEKVQKDKKTSFPKKLVENADL